ncbi:MAG TPA: hypothetical protein PKU97_00920 [Kofleriaceae bacterium]|nr:hypothetical protein [Kofleriaceae bacterium]
MSTGALLCALACLVAWRGRRGSLRPFDIAALVYLSTSALAVFSTSPQISSWGPWWTLHASAFAVLAAASAAAHHDKRLLAEGIVCVATVIALIAIYEAAGGTLPWQIARRPGATFANRNAVGGFCAIALPLALAQLAHRPRWFRGLQLTALAVVVLLCRARSSWLALIAVSGLAALASWSGVRAFCASFSAASRRLLLGAAAATVLLVAVVPWPGLVWKEDHPLWSSASRLLDYESGTGRSRVQQHEVAVAMIAAAPWMGAGPNGWRREGPRFTHVAGEHTVFMDPLWTPASDPLRQAVESGLPSLLAAAAMVLALIWGVRRVVAEPARPWTLALGCSLLVAVVICGFDALLARPASAVLVAAIAGMLRQEAPPWRGSFRASHASAGLLLITLVAVAVALPRYVATLRLAQSPTADAVERASELVFPTNEALLLTIRPLQDQPCAKSVPAVQRLARHLPNELRLLKVLARCALQERRVPEARSLLGRLRDLEPHDMEVKALDQTLANLPAKEP